MFGKFRNSIKQGSEAANAVVIIQQVSGIEADELMITNLLSRAKINQQSFISMNAHEYAFNVMFSHYVDLGDGWGSLRKDWITKDHPLRKKIIDAFDIFVAKEIISNSYIIGLYEIAKGDLYINIQSHEFENKIEVDNKKQFVEKTSKFPNSKKEAFSKKNTLQTEVLKDVAEKLVTTNSQKFFVNEKVVPKGVLTITEPQKILPQRLIQESEKKTIARKFFVNEKVVPKGVLTITEPKKPLSQLLIHESEKKSESLNLAENKGNKLLSKFRCNGCLKETSEFKLLKSQVGAGWRKCPFCEMNFQI